MSGSVIVAGSFVGVCLLFAGLAAWSGVRYGGGPMAYRRAVIGMVVLGLAGGAYAYRVGEAQSRVTLFEVDIAAAPQLDLVIPVEHPGVTHLLTIDPKLGPGLRQAREPVALQFSLSDPSGSPLLDQQVTLQVRCERRCAWNAWEGSFTPASAGPHALRIALLTPDVPRVFVRVEDPLKTDGQRAPGY